jgi:hypothetical protein
MAWLTSNAGGSRINVSASSSSPSPAPALASALAHIIVHDLNAATTTVIVIGSRGTLAGALANCKSNAAHVRHQMDVQPSLPLERTAPLPRPAFSSSSEGSGTSMSESSLSLPALAAEDGDKG